MFFTRTTAAAVLAAGLPVAFAQTFTSCNPTEKVCPSDAGLAVANFESDFTQAQNASWTPASYSFITYGDKGAEFTIAKADQAPTMGTDFYIFFGRVDVTMQAAEGQGIISSIVLESDDLDEIDWEFLGGNYTTVETNFFGKGNTTLYDRAIYYPVTNPQTQFHTYTVDWTPEALTFMIDGTAIRTVTYSNYYTVFGKNYPQTPMRLKLGNWAGGAPGEPEGTVEWAGGPTDFSKAPFTMYVKDVKITNYMPASTYTYGDLSGDWQSIKMSNSSSSDSSSSASSSASATGSSASSSATGSSSDSASAAAPTSSLPVGNAIASGAIVSSTIVSSVSTATATTTGTSSSATGSATQSASTSSFTGAASANQVAAAGSILGMVFSLFMLL